MHVQRLRRQTLTATSRAMTCQPLRLVPRNQVSPARAFWCEALPLVPIRKGVTEDSLLLVIAGQIHLEEAGALHCLREGDAAIVHINHGCKAWAGAAGAQWLAVGLCDAARFHSTLPVHLQQAANAGVTHEFNTRFRRLPLLRGSDCCDWGSALALIAPLEATTPHSHIDSESFVLLHGSGRVTINDESREVEGGDVVHLPSGSTHTLHNTTAEELRFFCTWWTSPPS